MLKITIDAEKAGISKVEAQLIRASIYSYHSMMVFVTTRLPSNEKENLEAAHLFAAEFFPEVVPHMTWE